MGHWTKLMILFGLVVTLQPGCADDIQGQVKLMVVPMHDGRNPTQDPFSLVDSVELGLMGDDASYKKLGEWYPSEKFGSDLLEEQGVGSFTMTGLNEKGRSVSRGFGPYIGVFKGVDEYLSIPFARIDYAFANRLRPSERALADPYKSSAPSLLMDETNLEQGQRDGDMDSGCLMWLLWDSDELWIKALVRDDSLDASGVGPVMDGDALVVYLDVDSDGEPGDPDDLKIAVGPDGRTEPEGLANGVDVQTVAGGYLVQFRLPLKDVGKNQVLGFDVRQVDVDEGDSLPSLLTWVYDPRKQGQDPEPADFGKLVCGVPILNSLSQPGAYDVFQGPDGLAKVGSWWDPESLHFVIDLKDDDVKVAGDDNTMDGADVVEITLDLDNSGVPVEDQRFFKIAVSAGGSQSHEAGPDIGNMTAQGVTFSGSVKATVGAEGYMVELNIPWQDLKLAQPPQLGWFLGLEVSVLDRDSADESLYSWSDSFESPEVWSELRLFGLQ